MWSAVADTGGVADGTDWIARIRRLEEEVNGLRRAQRTRGLIEQAKGILAERAGTDPEDAFKQLSQQSQQRNVPVVELAAEIVAGGSDAGSAASATPLKRAAVAATTAVSLPELAEILWREGLSQAGAAQVGIAVDGRVIAAAGEGGDPLAGELHPIQTANAEAVLAVRWDRPRKPLPANFVKAINAITSHLWVPAETPWDQMSWLQPVLTAVFAQGKLLSPVRDEAGAIVDFVVDYATREVSDLFGRSPSDIVGSRLLDLEPHLVDLGVFAAYVTAMEDGNLYERPASYETLLYRGRPRRLLLRRRAVRVGDRLLVSQQHLDRAQRQNEQVAQMEVLGRLGFAEWDLATGDVLWSAGFYRLFGREIDSGPSALDRLVNLVVPEDVPAVKGLLLNLLEVRRPAEVEFRVAHGTGERRTVHLTAEPKLTPQGQVHLVQAVASDITEERAAAVALRRTEAQLGEHRMRAAAEREMTRQMRQIWYPATALELEAPGLRVLGRHWVAEEDWRFQADFLDAIEAADGDVLISIGDIVGSGLAAAATMARLMYPARVMGHAGSHPAEILRALNLELHRGQLIDLAGMVLARYLTAERKLVWAQAGHLPPVLLRGGTARLLTPPQGTLLGLSAQAGYGSATLDLMPNDLVILFTGGVAASRSLAEPLSPLLRTFEKQASRGGPQAILEAARERSEGEACLIVAEIW
jgi:serine phosphatase RsbU (regulator of sigma subunit)